MYAMKKIVFLLSFLLPSIAAYALDLGFYMDAVEIMPGTEQQLSLKVVNGEGIKGFQLSIVLPEGLSFVDATVTNEGRLDDIGYMVKSAVKASGALEILAVYGGTPIAAGDGVILSFKVKAADDAVVGEKNITLSGIKISTESQNHVLPDVSVSAFIGDRAQSVDDVRLPSVDMGSVYDFHGRCLKNTRLSVSTPGNGYHPNIYIVGGRKIVVR